jgi:hypothetical protein
MQGVMPPSLPATEQHACPDEPQAPQVPGTPVSAVRPAHPSPAVHWPLVPLPQQTWFEAPHAEHLSPVAETTHERPVVHSVPLLQQAWSAPPHGAHMPPPPSTWPAQLRPPWQLPPAQQAWFAPPQFSQVLLFAPGGLAHPSPALQPLFAQHGLPKPPQVPHAVTAPPSGPAVVRHCSAP